MTPSKVFSSSECDCSGKATGITNYDKKKSNNKLGDTPPTFLQISEPKRNVMFATANNSSAKFHRMVVFL